jgi:hypothetical protein
MFWEYHADGAERIFLKHQLTQQDITNEYIPLPTPVLSVLRVLPVGGALGNTSNLQYVMYMTDVLNYKRFMNDGVHGYAVTMSYLNTLQDMFNPERVLSFNVHKNRMSLQTDWGRFNVGDFMLIECYSIIDPEDFPEVWNNKWLRMYTTALFKRQWGSNLTKYSGAQLSGGITINGDKIYDDAVNEIEKLEERLRNEYAFPIDFYVA